MYNAEIEKINLEMSDVSFTEPFFNEGVSDEKIISDLEEMTDIDLTDRDGRTPLINAAFYNRINVVKYLLDRGANINAQDDNGFAPLHAAANNENIDMAKMLLAHNADSNLRNMYGNSPILCCNSFENLDLYKLLLNNGADARLKNDSGISFYDYLTMTRPDLLSILLGE